jgi:hypothetical protein
MQQKEQKIINAYLNDKTLSLKDIQKLFGITRYSLDKLFKKNNIAKRKNQSEYCQKSRKWFFDEQFFLNETPETAYFMGFCLADGSLFKPAKSKYYTWYIGIHNKDNSILEQFCKWINIPKNHIRSYGYKNVIRLTSKFFDRDFSKWGIVQNKTYEAIPPNIRLDIIKYFLIGLIDGDGSIGCEPGKGYKFNLVSNKIITKWFETTIRSLGYNGKLTYEDNPDKVWNRIRITNKKDVLELAQILDINHCDFCLDRKWKTLKSILVRENLSNTND